MIFVCTGSRKFQFDRLIKEIDRLVGEGIIKQEVFAQIAETSYEPKFIPFTRYMTSEDFLEYQKKADIIISHGGTGALINASKLGKNIIGVPRLSKYGEHSDDHQLQIVSVLESEGYIRGVYDIKDLGQAILDSINKPIVKRYQRQSRIIEIIEEFIDSI